MSKREEYNLEFTKKVINGRIYHGCDRNLPPNELTYLCGFLEALHDIEIQALIGEIEAAENEEYYEEYPQSEGYEHYDIQIDIPNFLIGSAGTSQASIPLDDMRSLLIEWRDFKKS